MKLTDIFKGAPCHFLAVNLVYGVVNYFQVPSIGDDFVSAHDILYALLGRSILEQDAGEDGEAG